MVDFQSRDTRRGTGTDDEADDGEDDGVDAPDDADGRRTGAGDHDGGADGTDGGQRDGRADGDAGDGGARDSDHRGDDHPSSEHPDGHDHGSGDADHTHQAHTHNAHDLSSVGVAVVTVSSSRSLADDPAGDAVAAALEDAGDAVVTRELVRDDFDGIQRILAALVGRDDVHAVVTTGGTGVAPDDVTVEAATQLFEKRLPGFGELFRRRSEAEIGSRAVATRATAGVVDGVLVFCLPGSESAVRLATSELIVPEVDHLAGLASRDGDRDDPDPIER